MKLVHLQRLTDPPLLAAIVGLAVTTQMLTGGKEVYFERGVFVAGMLHMEKQSKRR